MKKSLFLLDFSKQNLDKKSVGILVGIINVMQNFCPSSDGIIRTTSCQKRSFCYLETLN